MGSTGRFARRNWQAIRGIVAAGSSGGGASQSVALTATELAEIRMALEAEVVRLTQDLHCADVDIAGLIADSGDGAGDDQADTGSKTFEREQEMSVTANLTDLLEQSRRALTRLEAGTYGICEACGGQIRTGRLKAFPRATLCIACKQLAERR